MSSLVIGRTRLIRRVYHGRPAAVRRSATCAAVYARGVRILLAACVLVTSATAHAHIALTYPPPRTASQKTGPCGAPGSARGANVTRFAPGETVTIKWDETVDHPGHFRISFDDDGQDFTNPSTPDDAFAQTMVEPIADKSGGSYTQSITLPTTPCENCTLQLMQIMTTVVPYNSFYWQCADISIGDASEVPGDDEPAATSGGCATSTPGSGALILVAIALGLNAKKRRALARRSS